MPLPQRIAGRDLFWYLQATGLMGKNTDTRLGRRMQARDALIGSSPRAIRRRGVQLRPRTTAVSGSTVTFDDGSALTVSAVIWATGFGLDHSWIDVPVFDADRQVVHQRGITAASGLYFLGMPWQHTRGSALLGWVKDVARHLAEHIGTVQNTRPAPIPA
jgi:putative flavoprotein involved in K+ transport